MAVLADAPAHGTLALNDDGSFLYEPEHAFVGADSFTYYPTDAGGPGQLTTVSLAVTDHPPVANNDAASTDEDTSVAIAVLSNDTDADADPLTVIGVSEPINGAAFVNTNGTVTYTPGPTFTGTDQFVYVVADDSSRTSLGTVMVTVSHVNHAPVAVNDSFPVLIPNFPR